MTRNLETELMASESIRQRCRNDVYAQNLYAALCNMRWTTEVQASLEEELWSCSWRYSGGIVADLRNVSNVNPDGIAGTEEYTDWYCSGMLREEGSGCVPEGTVTEQIRQDLADLGWHPVPYPDSE